MTASPVLTDEERPVYGFRPMTAHDLEMVRLWLTRPHVQEWWGSPGDQFDLVSEDLSEPGMDQYVVSLGERPFAYLQCYLCGAYPESGLGLHPQGARGIDRFIGDEDLVGQGHGSAFVRAFVDRLLAAGVPRVITDPDPANARAIRAYTKAGFRADRLIDTPDGRALLMIRDGAPAG